MTDPDPRDKPLENVVYTQYGRTAHFILGKGLTATTYCGVSGWVIPTTDAGWEHVKKLPTCRRCEEMLRPMPKNFTHTVTVEITDTNTLVLHNGGRLPVMAQQALMSQALTAWDQGAIYSIQGFPYDKGEGWAKFRFSKIKELRV